MGFPIQDLIGFVILAAAIAALVVLWKRKKRIAAIVLGLFFVLLWIAIALPGLKRARNPRAACINNLTVIQRVKGDWAKQHNKQPSDVPLETDLFGADKLFSEMPRCPAGGIITIGAANQKPSCSLAEQGHAIPDEATPR